MTAEEARTHIRYTGWASRKLLDAVLGLPEEVQQRDVGASHKGLRETLAHIHYGDRVWLHRVLGLKYEASADPMEIDWPRVQQRWEEWAERADDAEVGRVVEFLHPNGNTYRFSVAQMVMHVVNHAT